MNRSMSTGATALNAFQKALNVQSNNLANVNTTSFKSDAVSFSDMMYDREVGIGSFMDTPKKSYSQGDLKPTHSNYDFAIEGKGFFTLQDPTNPDRLLYTRTGQFKNDKENFLSDTKGRRVLGIAPTVSGDVITSEFTKNIVSAIIKKQDSVLSVNTYVTDYTKEARATGDTGVSGQNFKTVDSNINDIEALRSAYDSAIKAYSINQVEGDVAKKAETTITFPITASANNKYTMEALVNGVKIQQDFDESIENTLQQFSNKINKLSAVTSSVDTTTGVVTISSMVSGKNLLVSQPKLNNSALAVIKISDATGSGQNLIDATYGDLQAVMQNVNAKVATNKSEILRPQSGEQPNKSQLVLDLHKLGMSDVLYEKLLSGDPQKVAVYPGIESEEGYIYLKDGGTRFLIGKIAPVTFTNASKLNPQGDGLYAKGYEQSDPMFLKDSAKVLGSYLENSNVDVSKELVDLIVFQKAYEANSKSISTSDELLKTALALKNK